MNKKNKILFSAAGMLVLTAAAASASTFAWFTTVRNATINYSQAEVYSSSSDLTVAYVSSLNNFTTSSSTDSQHVDVTGVPRITDISGNGQYFYKPIWNSADTDSSQADDVTDLMNPFAGADGYYVDFTLAISQSEFSTGDMNVYVGEGTTITPHNTAETTPEQASKNGYAVQCARLAILDETSTPVFIWTPDLDASYTYVAADTLGDQPAWNTQEHVYAVTQTPEFDDIDNFHAGALTTYKTVSENTAAHVRPIVTLYGRGLGTEVNPNYDYSDEITIRAWIEGEDPECKNSLTGGANALGGVFDLSIDIYGIAA